MAQCPVNIDAQVLLAVLLKCVFLTWLNHRTEDWLLLRSVQNNAKRMWKQLIAASVVKNGLPRWCSIKDSACQCRRCKRTGFSPWVRKIPWRRKWQPTPVFLPEKFHGQRSLLGYSPWGHKQSDKTEQLTHTYIPTHMVKNDESLCSDWTQIAVWACNMTFSPQRSEFLFIFCKIQ